MGQDALISVYAKLFGIGSVFFLSYELFILVIGLSAQLSISLHLVYFVLRVFHASRKRHGSLLHLELLNVTRNVS